jgi:hypothetical protein
MPAHQFLERKSVQEKGGEVALAALIVDVAVPA